MSFEKAIVVVLENEKGYVFDPNDPGGETKYGISKRMYPHLDIKNLPKEDAIAIYKEDYWDKYNCGRLPEPLDLLYFDSVVNHHPKDAGIILQKTLNNCGAKLVTDGIVGPKTLAAVDAIGKNGQCPYAFLLNRIKLYVSITRKNKKLRTFFRGWIIRVSRLFDIIS